MDYKILPYKTNKNGYLPADTVSISILNSYNDHTSFLYAFYNLFCFECYYSNGYIIHNVELDWECPTLSRKEVPRSVLHSINDLSIIDFIISSINEGYYIYLTLDSSKINCYNHNNMVFMPHPLLIYGYDQIKKEFYIADYFRNSTYSHNKLSYNEFNNANNSLLSHMKVLDPLCGTNDSILDIEFIKYLNNCNIIVDSDYIRHSIDLFLNGRWTFGNKFSYKQNRTLPRTAFDEHGNMYYYEAATSNEKYGINVFWEIAHHLKRCIDSDKYFFNFMPIHLLNLYYELFIEKMVILKQEIACHKLHKTINRLLDDAKEHRKSLQMAVSISLKYEIKKECGTDEKKYLVSVSNIIEKEIQYIYDINYLLRDTL